MAGRPFLFVIFCAILSTAVAADEKKPGTKSEPCPGLVDTPADFLAAPAPPSVGNAPVPGPAAGAGTQSGVGATPAGSAPPATSGASSGLSGTRVGNYFLDSIEKNTGSGSANAVLTLQNAMLLSQLARGNEFVQDAAQSNAKVRAAEQSDRGMIEKHYDNVSYRELNNRLERAEGELTNIARYVDEKRLADVAPADQAFFRNSFANAADKAKMAREILRESRESKDTEKKYTQKEVRELLDMARQEQSSLIDRMLLLNGLAEREREELVRRLNLAEQVRIVLPNGSSRKIPLLHNGYLNAAGRSDLDCATFVAATLSPKFRKANLTTLDLRGIWNLSRTGYLPQNVKWAKGRETLLRKVASGFEAVDLYLGEKPVPGDLLVHRVLSETNGRVAVVREYDDKKMIAKVAEPSGDGSHLIEYDFALSEDPETSSFRSLRPGLANLRLLPNRNSACNQNSKPGGK